MYIVSLIRGPDMNNTDIVLAVLGRYLQGLYFLFEWHSAERTGSFLTVEVKPERARAVLGLR